MLELCRVATKVNEVKVERRLGLVDSLHYLSGEMGKTYSAIRQLYTAVNSIPKISQPLNIARQNVCKTLKDILTNVETGRDYCEETISAIENQIHPIE